MSRVQLCAVCVALVSLASFPGLASSGTPSVGASLGIALYLPTHQDDVLTVGIPGSAGQVVPGFMPGFRFTITDDSGANAVIFEPGFNMVAFSSQTITQLQGMLSYQRVFVPQSTSSSPFVNVGGGILYQGGFNESASNAVIGGGLGVRVRSSHGHGQGRVEVRLDYITKDQTGFTGGSVLGIKFGFDLDLDTK